MFITTSCVRDKTMMKDNFSMILHTVGIILLTLCGSTYCIASSGDRTSILVNGVVKECVTLANGSQYFEYTTPQDDALLNNLNSTSKLVPYEKFFPEGTENQGFSKKLVVFRDYMLNTIRSKNDMRKHLEGKRIRIFICIKPDGTVVLKRISSSEDILNYVSPETVKQLISVIKAYRFAPSGISGPYYINAFVGLSAQSFNIGSLTGKTWNAISGYNYSQKVNMDVVFSNTSAKFTLTFKGENTSPQVVTDQMYLSETYDKSFDKSKVGKNTMGKYIVMAGNRAYKGKPYQSLTVYKIVSLTSNKLVVESGNLNKIKITFVSN